MYDICSFQALIKSNPIFRLDKPETNLVGGEQVECNTSSNILPLVKFGWSGLERKLLHQQKVWEQSSDRGRAGILWHWVYVARTTKFGKDSFWRNWQKNWWKIWRTENTARAQSRNLWKENRNVQSEIGNFWEISSDKQRKFGDSIWRDGEENRGDRKNDEGDACFDEGQPSIIKFKWKCKNKDFFFK